MFEQPVVRWIGYAAAAALILGTIVTWWLPAGSMDTLTVPAKLLAKLAATEPEQSSPLLTDIYDALAKSGDVHQVLLLQAVPNDVPIVVATIEDSSDEEEATHWPSPWSAVNTALETGSLLEQLTVQGRHAGFDYAHTLVPVDETRSRVLLINQAAPAPSWSLQRALLLLAGVFILIVLMATRE